MARYKARLDLSFTFASPYKAGLFASTFSQVAGLFVDIFLHVAIFFTNLNLALMDWKLHPPYDEHSFLMKKYLLVALTMLEAIDSVSTMLLSHHTDIRNIQRTKFHCYNLSLGLPQAVIEGGC